MAHHVKAHHGGSPEDVTRACKRADHPNGMEHASAATGSMKHRAGANTKRQAFPRPTRSGTTQSMLCLAHPGPDVGISSRPDYLPVVEGVSGMAVDSWVSGTPGMAPGESVFEDAIFTFLAQSDANVTDAEMISISQDVATSSSNAQRQ
jgi:hypothetical protein